MKKNYLLLFTDYFPFGKWEPYLRPEFKYLSQSFDRVFIFCNHQGSGKPVFELPPNTEFFFLNPHISLSEKLGSVRFVFSKMFWTEFLFAKSRYRIPVSLAVVKLILITMFQANRYQKRIQKYLPEMTHGRENYFVYSYWSDYRAVAAALLKRKRSVVAFSRAHGWDVYFERHKVPYLPFRKFLSDNLSNIFFVSEDGRKYFMEKTGKSSDEKLQVSRLAIAANEKNKEAEPQSFRIVSCANLVPLKRTVLVAEILQHIAALEIEWVHFGSGASEKKFLEDVQSRLAGKRNIHFHFKGNVDHEEVMSFYRENPVDLFVLTSEYEGMPFVIIEALSFGIPVMATDVGGIREVINEENGFLLPKNFSSVEAAEKIKWFDALSPSAKAAYRQKAFETWNEYFNAEKRFPAFIEEVMQLGNKSAE